jgi:hypothetical protein
VPICRARRCSMSDVRGGCSVLDHQRMGPTINQTARRGRPQIRGIASPRCSPVDPSGWLVATASFFAAPGRAPRAQNGQSVRVMRVKRLRAEDVSLVGAIDRSEHIDVQYRVSEGQLRQVPAAITEVPTWDSTGSGPHSVAAEIDFCSSVVAGGGVLLGTFDEERGRARDSSPFI